MISGKMNVQMICKLTNREFIVIEGVRGKNFVGYLKLRPFKHSIAFVASSDLMYLTNP